MVRARELHCRRGWSDDRWMPTRDDRVLEVRFKSPQADRSSQPLETPEPSARLDARTVESIVMAWEEPTVRAEANGDSPRP